jgi:hypothetical protein
VSVIKWHVLFKLSPKTLRSPKATEKGEGGGNQDGRHDPLKLDSGLPVIFLGLNTVDCRES